MPPACFYLAAPTDIERAHAADNVDPFVRRVFLHLDAANPFVSNPYTGNLYTNT